MDLRCNKLDCTHNCKYSCEADGILITKSINCDTYKKGNNTENLQDVSKTMFESAPEIAGYKHNDHLCVNCNAHCLFNREGKCNANGITVLSDEHGKCGTFIEE